MIKFIISILSLSLAMTAFGQKKTQVLTERERSGLIYPHDTIQLKEYNTPIVGFYNNDVIPNTTNTYVVEYDFRSSTYTRNNLKAKVNRPMIFQIININKLAYAIDIKAQDSILANSFNFGDLSQWVSAAEQLKTEASITTAANQTSTSNIVDDDLTDELKKKDTSEVSEVKEELNKVQNSTYEAAKLKSIADSIERKKEELTSLKRAHQDILQKIDSLNNLGSDSQAAAENDSDIKRLKEESAYKNYENDSARYTQTIEQLQFQFEKQNEKVVHLDRIKQDGLRKFAEDSRNYIDAYVQLMSYYADIRQLMIDYNDMMVIASNPTLTKDSYTKLQQEKMQDAYRRLYYANRALENMADEFDQLQPLYVQLKSNPSLDKILAFGGKQKLYAYVESLKANVDKIQKGFDKKVLAKIVEEMTQCIPLLESDENYYITSDPIQPKNDVVVFSVNIRKRAGNDSKLAIERSFRHEEYLRRGLRIDLGIGLAGSLFAGNKVYDITYKSDNAKISERSKHTFIPSVIGMMTLGFRSHTYYMFGVSAAVGVDTNEGQIQISNFYVGPSLTIGRYDRITLAGGIAIKNVDILKKGYDLTTNYPLTLNETDIMTKQYKTGVFLSLTYNLTKGMKDNIKYLKYTGL